MEGLLSGARLKAALRRVLQRRGITVFVERPPTDLLAPQPVEEAARRVLVRALLERLEINCVIDVGAHVGEYGAFLRSVGYSGAIFSFEPVRASFDALAQRATGDPNWQTRQLALGAESGGARLGVARERNFSSFLAPTDFSVGWYGGSAVVGQEHVEVERLDQVFDRLVAGISAPRVLLKTDTQGFDLAVIEGASEILHRVSAVQVELSVLPIYENAPDWLTVLSALRARGFDPVHLSTVNRYGDLRAVEFDALMVRGGSD